MKKLIVVAIAFLFAISMIGIALMGCVGNDANNLSELEPVEINEWPAPQKGVQL